jgi:hypothetical protein
MNVEVALRLDVLSYFFKNNQECRERYGNNLGTSMVRSHFLSKIFHIDPSDIHQFEIRYR